MRLNFFLLLVSVLLTGPYYALAQNQAKVISGFLIDEETEQPLSYGIISIKGTNLGTTTNEDGYYTFIIPEEHLNDTLTFNYIGYKGVEIPINQAGENTNISLLPYSISLKEVVIYPISPEERLKAAIKKLEANYTTEPIQAYSYLSQKVKENSHFLNHQEAYFRSYYPNYLDPKGSQHQVLLHREREDVASLAFGQAKESRKREKDYRKGRITEEEYQSEIESNEEDMVDMGTISPQDFLESDPLHNLETFLDTNLFKKFNYWYEGAVSYLGREMVIIAFESKGPVKSEMMDVKVKQKGRIYVDNVTDAIGAIEVDSKIKIPGIVQPIIFLAGYSLRFPIFSQKIQYQRNGRKWFPQTLQLTVGFGITDRNLFSPSDKSDFDIDLLLSINDIQTSNVQEIPEELRIKEEEELKDQIQPDPNISWDNVNAIQLISPLTKGSEAAE